MFWAELMLKNSKSGGKKAVTITIKRVLSSGPKRARDITKACEKEGIKEPTVHYWLKKLQGRNEVRKIRGKYGYDVYELIKLEDADRNEVELLQKTFEEGNHLVKKAVAEDIRIICANKRVTHINWILEFLGKAIGDFYNDEVKEEAIVALRFVVLNSKKFGDEEAIEDIRENFQKRLKEIVLDRDLDSRYRDMAVEILDKILSEEDSIKVSWDILTELSKEKPFYPARYIWRRFLDRHFPNKKLEILEKLYPMIGDKDKSVREMASILLDELRAKERGVS